MTCFMKWVLSIFKGTKVNLNARKSIFSNVHCIEFYWQFQIPFESILSDVDRIREHSGIKCELVDNLHKASSI
jgi:hypothetical protein